MAEVEQERRGAVHVLRINRPEARNALNPAVLGMLGFGFADADADPEVRAIVLTGTGEQAMCAGMDLRGFASGVPQTDEERKGVDAYQRFIRGGVTKPVIAAANGSAVAGGFELLLACDLAVVASAARFGLPEVKRALFPAGGGLFLGRRIPVAVALELTLTGDTIDAERALALGLVNRVVPGDQVLVEAVALAQRIVANGPLAVRAIKRLVRAASSLPAPEAWALQDELRPGVFDSADAKEGAIAFIEKRAPTFQGH
jgi:enoyl-CoA hydratase